MTNEFPEWASKTIHTGPPEVLADGARPSVQAAHDDGSNSTTSDARIPADKRERFGEVARLLEDFGRSHLDAELTGFTLELWRRICRKQTIDCRRGKPHIWAASVVHVIARMNFLFDRGQPVHLTFDVICGAFAGNKTTVGSKATEIERALRLRQHSEPGLCRSELVDSFTTVQLSNGILVSLEMAKRMGLVPLDAMPR